MRHLLIAIALIAPQAQALDWPWSDTEEAPDDSCIGFIGAGLADPGVAGWSRTQLWLAWNRYARDGLGDLSVFQPLYQSGSERYAALPAATDGNLLDIADGKCGLPRD